MTQYAICLKRYFYGPEHKKSRLIDQDTGCEWNGTKSDAAAKIAELDNAVYHLSHGEYCRPRYTIVKF